MPDQLTSQPDAVSADSADAPPAGITGGNQYAVPLLLAVCVAAFVRLTVAGSHPRPAHSPTPVDTTDVVISPVSSGRSLSDSSVLTTVQLEAGDHLIIASLDQTAARHRLRVESSALGSVRQPDGLRDAHASPSIDFQEVRPRQFTPGFPHPSATRFRQRVPGSTAEPNTTLGDSRGDSSESDFGSRTFRLPWFPRSSRTTVTSSQFSTPTTERVVRCVPLQQDQTVRVYSDGSAFSADRLPELITLLSQFTKTPPIDRPGPVSDVDQDGYLSLVICRLSESIDDQKVPLLGCVRAGDFLDSDPLGGDIIYLDGRLLARPSLPAVLIHEMAHAALFSRIRRLRDQDVDVSPLPAWLNEAIAHSCEYHECPNSPNLSDRIDDYLCSPGHWPLIPPRRLHGRLSTRGPVRAAGLFYVEAMREQMTLDELSGEVLLSGYGTPSSSRDDFSTVFRQWTIWMSDHQRAGTLPLALNRLTQSAPPQDTVIRGTAATWWQATDDQNVTVSATARCRLQLTVIRAGQASSCLTGGRARQSERLCPDLNDGRSASDLCQSVSR